MDVWSCGVVMADLVLRRAFLPAPVDNDELARGGGEIKQMETICAALGTPNEEVLARSIKVERLGSLLPSRSHLEIRHGSDRTLLRLDLPEQTYLRSCSSLIQGSAQRQEQLSSMSTGLQSRDLLLRTSYRRKEVESRKWLQNR